ncbi:MAG: hypothetical protein Q9218_008325 [Villophora microphyllina]
MSSSTTPQSIEIPGMTVYHYFIKESTLTYYEPHYSVDAEHFTPEMIGSHDDEPGAPLRQYQELKGRLDADPRLANADARVMMDTFRANHFDCDFREGEWEDGRLWSVAILWDGSKRYELEVRKEDKRGYKPPAPRETDKKRKHKPSAPAMKGA